MSAVVVAVDGPAGSGKSSVSRAAAKALGYDFLDTGAAYRAVTWWVLEREAEPEDPGAVTALLQDFAYEGALHPDERWVRVNDRDVTDAIRRPRVAGRVSAVARVPAVRERLTALFRRAIERADHGIVVEGRDITTVVAPDARVRVLLTASPEARAARRAAELPHLDPDAVAKGMAARDAKDLTVVDFLTAAPGVTELDSTELDFAGTVDALVAIVHAAEDAADDATGGATDDALDRVP